MIQRYEILKRRFGSDGNLLLVDCPDGEWVTFDDHAAAVAAAVTAERERLNRAIELLRRYRNETPIGHQPHMIAAQVDDFLRQTDTQQ